jgi:tetrahydromethanopterin S-methyltransferase subunit B
MNLTQMQAEHRCLPLELHKSMNNVSLRDIYNAINRLEDKVDTRLSKIETRTSILESFNANLTGKIIGFMFFVNLAIFVGVEYLKTKFFK